MKVFRCDEPTTTRGRDTCEPNHTRQKIFDLLRISHILVCYCVTVLQKLADTVRPRVQEHLGGSTAESFDLFQATHYTQQVVAGMIYHIKIQTSNAGDECVHVRIFEPLPYTQEPPQLQAAVVAKLNDALVPLAAQL